MSSVATPPLPPPEKKADLTPHRVSTPNTIPSLIPSSLIRTRYHLSSESVECLTGREGGREGCLPKVESNEHYLFGNNGALSRPDLSKKTLVQHFVFGETSTFSRSGEEKNRALQ